MISIIDYGLGNLASIQNMLRVIGEKSVITGDYDVIMESDGIILPGVGTFDVGMGKLSETGLVDVIKRYAEYNKPVLGICLGMQLLGRRSEEGKHEGLGLIPFECIHFKLDDTDLKVPHMGWDVVGIKQDHDLVRGFNCTQRYYFVHSYHAVCDNEENVLMTCNYGYSFAAAVANNNVMGVQFHPEKSHDYGLNLLRNYVRICRKE